MCRNVCICVFPEGGRYVGSTDTMGMPRLPYPGPGVKAVERKCLEMASFVTSAESPCCGCCLVADPADCNNKNCQLWQRWYVARWDVLRMRLLGKVGQ